MTDSLAKSSNKLRKVRSSSGKFNEKAFVDFLQGIAFGSIYIDVDQGLEDRIANSLAVALRNLTYNSQNIFNMSPTTQILFAQKLPDFFFDAILSILDNEEDIEGSMSKKAIREGVQAARRLPDVIVKEATMDVMAAMRLLQKYNREHPDLFV